MREITYTITFDKKQRERLLDLVRSGLQHELTNHRPRDPDEDAVDDDKLLKAIMSAASRERLVPRPDDPPLGRMIAGRVERLPGKLIIHPRHDQGLGLFCVISTVVDGVDVRAGDRVKYVAQGPNVGRLVTWAHPRPHVVDTPSA